MQEAVLIVYSGVAAAFIVATLNELEGQPWGIWRVTGLALSLAWPVAILLVVLSIWRHDKGACASVERTRFAEHIDESRNTDKTAIALDSTEQA